MIVCFIVVSLVFVGPMSHALLRLMPEPPEPSEPTSPPVYYGPSRRLLEVAQALA